MFDAEYLLFCAGKSTDENGNLSLHGIFEHVYAPSFPVRHQPFFVVFKLRAKKAVINQHLKIKISMELKNKEAARADMEGDFTVEKDNSLTPAIDVSQFIFPEAGLYSVKLYVEDTLLVTRNLQMHPVEELTEK